MSDPAFHFSGAGTFIADDVECDASLSVEIGPNGRAVAVASLPFDDDSRALYGVLLSKDLFNRAWIDRAFELHASGALLSAERPAHLVLGLDPARLGPDHSALAIRQGRHVHGFRTWERLDTMTLADKVEAEVRGLIRTVGPVEAVCCNQGGCSRVE